MSTRGAFSLFFQVDTSTIAVNLLDLDFLLDTLGIAAYQPSDTEYGEIGFFIHAYDNEYTDTKIIKCGATLTDTVYSNTTIVDEGEQLALGPAGDYLLDFHIIMFDTCLSIYCNNVWIYSYVFAYVDYVNYAPVISLTNNSGDDCTLLNVRREEIPDQREAIYIDYESTGDNAIQSVYQQRPVRIYPQVDRSLGFTYRAIKDEHTPHHVLAYSIGEVAVTDLSSDGLVYFYDVGVSLDANVAKEVGLVTRLYRLSELNTGGTEAVKSIQEIALEQRNPINVTMRLDPRLEISDMLILDHNVTGTNTNISDEVIAEDIEISIQNGSYQMRVPGRRNK